MCGYGARDQASRRFVGVFTLEATCGHAQEMLTANNFAPGNASIGFHKDQKLPRSPITDHAPS